VLLLDLGQVALEGLAQAGGQGRIAVLVALSGAHHELVHGEVDVLDAEAAALEKAQAGAVEEHRHELGDAAHGAEDAAHLLPAQHDGQALGRLGAHDAVHRAELAPEHLLEEEEKGVEGLVLGRGADAAPLREGGEEAGDVRLGEALRLGAAVLQEAARPVRIRLLRAGAEAARADGGAQIIDERGRAGPRPEQGTCVRIRSARRRVRRGRR
jgi:hypothetical protein